MKRRAVVAGLWSKRAPRRTIVAMLSAEPPGRPRWVHRPLFVLPMLFVVLGPLGLPYLWQSPCFSRTAKIVLTVAVGVYTVLLIGETMRVLRALQDAMGEFGTIGDF